MLHRDCILKTYWVCFLVVLLFPPGLSADRKQKTDAARLDFFETKIRPVLAGKCFPCHSKKTNKSKGKLLLDSRESTLQGGETGRAVVPGDIKASLLIEAIRHEGLKMPPDEKLPDSVIADFEAWIEMGAPDPRGDPSSPVKNKSVDLKNAKTFWSFKPPQRHPLPETHNNQWIQRPIDAFILASLEQEALQPNRQLYGFQVRNVLGNHWLPYS